MDMFCGPRASPRIAKHIHLSATGGLQNPKMITFLALVIIPPTPKRARNEDFAPFLALSQGLKLRS
jgi:hypothetical protein